MPELYKRHIPLEITRKLQHADMYVVWKWKARATDNTTVIDMILSDKYTVYLLKIQGR